MQKNSVRIAAWIAALVVGTAQFASGGAVVDVFAGKDPATRVNLAEADWRRDCALTFEAAFAKDAPRKLDLNVFFPREKGVPAESWRNIRATIDLRFGTRIFNCSSLEDCGTPWYVKPHFDTVDIPDDAWHRIAIVSHDGYTSFFIGYEGRLQRTYTCRLDDQVRIAGLKFDLPAGVKVRNVKLRDFDAKLLPKGRAGFEVAKTPKTVEIPVAGDSTRFDFVPGGYPVTVKVTCEDGTNACAATFSALDQSTDLYLYMAERGNKEAVKLWEGGTMRGRRTVLDTGLTFDCAGKRIPVYTLPRLSGRYGYLSICQMVTNLTAYGEHGRDHVFRCEVRKTADGPRLYVDGDYMCTLPLKDVKKVAMRLPEGGLWRLGGKKAKSKAEGEQWKGNPLLEPIVFDEPFDTGVCRVNLGSYALECDGYMSRCPQERERNSFLRRIPLGTYLRARVRCRLGGRADRNTCLTARITNFYSSNNAGRNNECLDQQTKEIPRGTKGETEVVFDFDPGKIQDVIWQRGFKDLTFEVLGDCHRRHEYFDQGYLHPTGTSDVIVVGATLERSPAGMCVENAIYGNLFLPDEQPGFKVTAEALVAGRYAVDWQVTDVRGKPCETAHDALDLKAGERRAFGRTFARGRPGWYGVTATLRDAKGAALVTHRASYVLLAPGERKAGWDSPWFVWTGLGMHSRNGQAFTNAMELCRRGGIRHGHMGVFSEKEGAPWGMTLSPLPFSYGFSTAATPQEREAYYEKNIRALMERFPHAGATTVFHESGCKTRRGQKPDVEHDRDEVRKGTELCRVWRRLYPHVRLVLGNGGDGIDKLDQLFRAGFPKDLIDTMGEESVGGAIPSETNVSGNFMALRDLALEYGYDKVWPEACYEWKTRQRRNYDSPRQQAAMEARDAIIALAWGSRNITVSMSPEPDGCYFASSWGGGSHTKNPECHPLPVAAAVATETLVLDRCAFSRLVPTGSDTIYAVEFRDPDGRHVTALWSAKGSVKAKVEGATRKLRVTDLYGATDEVSGLFRATADVTVSEEPVYVVSEKPVRGVTVEGTTRDYPFERYAGAEKAKVLTQAPSADWTVDTKPLHGTNTKAGKTYALKDVADAEKGKVLELTRGADNEGRTVGGIRLKEPVVIPSDATTVGVWVRGNSSRGDVDFIIEDADGDFFHSTSRGWTRDWGEKAKLDFDGWRCVWMPLRNESPVRIYTAGMDISQLWRCSKYVKKQMKWPVKLLGVSCTWGDEIVYVNEKRKVTNQSVRLGPCVAF